MLEIGQAQDSVVVRFGNRIILLVPTVLFGLPMLASSIAMIYAPSLIARPWPTALSIAVRLILDTAGVTPLLFLGVSPFYRAASSRQLEHLPRRVSINQGLPTWGLGYLAPATETPSAGAVEVWQIMNLTGDTHPMHFYLVNVQLIQRQAPLAMPLGRTSTLLPPSPKATVLPYGGLASCPPQCIAAGVGCAAVTGTEGSSFRALLNKHQCRE